MVNAGYRAIDSLSIEKGYPHWHQEVVLHSEGLSITITYDAQVRMDDTPLEGGLLFTCKLKTDTDFLGRYTSLGNCLGNHDYRDSAQSRLGSPEERGSKEEESLFHC